MIYPRGRGIRVVPQSRTPSNEEPAAADPVNDEFPEHEADNEIGIDEVDGAGQIHGNGAVGDAGNNVDDEVILNPEHGHEDVGVAVDPDPEDGHEVIGVPEADEQGTGARERPPPFRLMMTRIECPRSWRCHRTTCHRCRLRAANRD